MKILNINKYLIVQKRVRIYVEWNRDIVIMISIFIMLFVMKKYNVLRVFSYGGRVENDFSDCFIISYPKRDELHNKGEVFDIDVEEFFKLNPKLKGKIPIEKRDGIKSLDTADIQMEINERNKIREKYSKAAKEREKRIRKRKKKKDKK